MERNGSGGSFCMDRARGRLKSLFWGVLFLFIAAALLVFAASTPGADGSGPDLRSLAAAALGLAALALGAYVSFISVRDFLFPSKSRLARSIRSQLPHPDEAPPVRELFDAVDRDIRENGIWFDQVAVGREWLLGDDARYLPRVRAVFGRNEIQRRSGGGRTVTGQVVQVYVLDDRRQLGMARLENPNELQPLLDSIKLRAPDALFLPYERLSQYTGMTDEEWAALEREYRVRKTAREAAAPDEKPAENQNMVFIRPDGAATSRVTEDMVRDALHSAIYNDETVFTLMPTVPYEAGGRSFALLQCLVLGVGDDSLDEDDLMAEAEIYLMAALTAGGGRPPESGLLLQCSYQEALDILIGWFRGAVPDTSGWADVDIHVWQPRRQAETHPPMLALETAAGVYQSHESFEREDVEAAAQGLADGTYKFAELTLPGGFLTFRAEAETPGGQCAVTATNDVDGELRFYRLDCSASQASRRLLDYYESTLRPKKPEWRDITKEVNRSIKQLRK